MKNRCKNEANLRCVLRKVVHQKTTFFEQGEIVLTLAGCSRMRVGEGSHENIKSEKCQKTDKKYVTK